jgi:hypothetical protein
MPANVQIGYIVIGSAANAVGVFNGQNMQNDWDSHSPSTATIGMTMGNHSLVVSQFAYMWNMNKVGQPLFDQDTKANGSPMLIGP